MKNYSLPLYIPTIFAFFFCLTLQAQEIYTIDESKLDHFINEVYADAAQTIVYSNPKNKQSYLDLLKRVDITEVNSTIPADIPLLSTIPVVTTYNKELTFDTVFSPNNFNPFKYKFNFFKKEETVYYLVDNTNYVIRIKPANK